MYRFNHEKLKSTLIKVLTQLNINNDSIFHVTNSMIETSLRGTDSHGIILFPHYINAIKNKRINSNPQFVFNDNTLTSSILNADHAIGHHSGAVAMKKAISNAKQYGMGSVAVKNSTHFGAAAYFGLIAAQQGCLGFSFTNADALVKASNAKHSFFGTNPICFAAPLANEEPFCLDMATSTISWNKRNNYLREKTKMNNGWAFDIDGKETTDPSLAASLSPSGDYKGFGLGMMVDILTSILADSLISKDIKPMYTSDIKEKRNIGHFFMAIDINGFSDLNEFKERLKSMVDRIRQMEKIADDNVMVPGDPEKRSRVIRLKEGIPIDEEKYLELLDISNEFKECLIND